MSPVTIQHSHINNVEEKVFVAHLVHFQAMSLTDYTVPFISQRLAVIGAYQSCHCSGEFRLHHNNNNNNRDTGFENS